jgi:hypothetical protein
MQEKIVFIRKYVALVSRKGGGRLDCKRARRWQIVDGVVKVISEVDVSAMGVGAADVGIGVGWGAPRASLSKGR